jgi:hypothetical protein
MAANRNSFSARMLHLARFITVFNWPDHAKKPRRGQAPNVGDAVTPRRISCGGGHCGRWP